MSPRPARLHLGAIIPTPPRRMFGELTGEQVERLGFTVVSASEDDEDVRFIDRDGREYEADDLVPAAALVALVRPTQDQEKS